MNKKSMVRPSQQGQGIVEFAGAMVVAIAIVSVLVLGMRDGDWMYESYNSLFHYAGEFLLERLSTI